MALEWRWRGLRAALGAAVLVVSACGGGGGGGEGPAASELTVSLTGDGSAGPAGPGRVTSQPAGLDCRSGTCTGRFAAHTAVTLTAAPAAGQKFTAWSGACSGTNPTCTLSLGESRSVGAAFAASSTGTTHTLTVQVGGGGTVVSQPAGIQCGTQCSANFAADTSVVLTATPGTGQSLSGWTGACTGSAGTCTVVMNAAKAVGVTFATALPAGWSGAQRVSGEHAHADVPFEPVRTAIDENGQALAVWFERPPLAQEPLRLMANRYAPASGWGTPVELAPAVANRRYVTPELALDPASGRAMLVWMQRDGTAQANLSLWSRAFDPATGWAATEAIQPFTAAAVSAELRVGIDAAGQATALWLRDADGAGPQAARVFANRHVRGSGWGTATEISGDTVGLQPKVAVAANGTALAVWGGFSDSLMASQYSAGAGWSTPTELVKAVRLQRGVFMFDVVMNTSGDGLLAWHDFEEVNSTSTYAIKAKRYLQGAWQTADLLVQKFAVPDASGLRPKIALNASGHSVIVWHLARDNSLHAAVGLAGQAWGVTAVKPADPAVSVTSSDNLQAGIDGLGHALLAWTQRTHSGNPDLMINRYSPASGWGGPTLHESYTGIGEIASNPALAMNDRGQSMLAWFQSIDKDPNAFERDFLIASRFYSSGR